MSKKSKKKENRLESALKAYKKAYIKEKTRTAETNGVLIKGISKGTIDKARKMIMDILNSNKSDQVILAALETLRSFPIGDQAVNISDTIINMGDNASEKKKK